MSHPLGLMIDDEPYVRSPQQTKDGAHYLLLQRERGMEMSVLESYRISLPIPAAAIDEKQQEIGPIKAIINFNCILHCHQLDSQGTSEDYGKIFAKIPTIGLVLTVKPNWSYQPNSDNANLF